MISVKMDGSGILEKMMKVKHEDLLNKLEISVTKRVLPDAVELVKKKTGRLMNSIRVRKHEKGVTIGSPLTYAPHNEYGTSKWEGKPFLRPAAYRNLSRVKADMVKAIKQEE